MVWLRPLLFLEFPSSVFQPPTNLLSSLISHLHLKLFSWQITFRYGIKLKLGSFLHLELDLPLIICDHPSAPPCAPTSLNSDSSFGHKSTFRRLHSSHHSFSQQSGQSGTHCTIIEQRRNLNNLDNLDNIKSDDFQTPSSACIPGSPHFLSRNLSKLCRHSKLAIWQVCSKCVL